MTGTALSSQSSEQKPVLGFILLGGSLSGALVRDVRLANECARRGYSVHVWWAMDKQKKPPAGPLLPQIQQHWLFHGMRYWGRFARGPMERVGHVLHALFDDKARAHTIQRRPKIMQRIMENLMRSLCDGVDRDAAVVHRFANDLNRTGVTHVLPMLEMLCPWVAAARRHVKHPLKYVVTFQGYELYSTYARSIGRERELYDVLKKAVEDSDWPAIAVSEDYARRVTEEIGVPPESLVAIPPGVPRAERMESARAHKIIDSFVPNPQPGVPLITYIGRRDTEKGIDILLYATRMLKERGHRFQLAICGPTLWGTHYGRVCDQIAEELRLQPNLRRQSFVSDEIRNALFSASHCVVYPSIHREPFGMVAAEAAAHGTPAVVPNYGGVASAIEANGEAAGLRFKVWDSGDLADQLERLLTDHALYRKLSEAGPRVAEYFSIEKLADRVLKHIGIVQP